METASRTAGAVPTPHRSASARWPTISSATGRRECRHRGTSTKGTVRGTGEKRRDEGAGKGTGGVTGSRGHCALLPSQPFEATACHTFRQPEGVTYERPGAGHAG